MSNVDRGTGKTTRMLGEINQLLPETIKQMPILVIGDSKAHANMLYRTFCVLYQDIPQYDRRILWVSKERLNDRFFTCGAYYREIFIDHFVLENRNFREDMP